ncbi:MAG: undecaprenyl-diphosphate phosphatase [Longimicrobiales bacterium]
MAELLKAIFLGVVEGATEFIPVSSTGHLILAAEWVGFEGPFADTFEIVIQLGAILAIVWIYRTKVLGSVARIRRDPAARRLWTNLLLAFAPAGIVGFISYETIKTALFSPVVVAAALVVGGIAILLIEWWNPPARVTDVDRIGARTAVGVGVAQILSLIPGVSRSGATIMGGLALGLSRQAAAEFSFFVAIPTMIIATGYELLVNFDALTARNVPILAAGFMTAFVSALVIVRAFVRFISTHTFVVFAWYRIVFGAGLLWYYLG